MTMKYIIVLTLFCCQYQLGESFVLQELKNMQYVAPLSSEESQKFNVKNKINWLPVLQEDEEHLKPIPNYEGTLEHIHEQIGTYDVSHEFGEIHDHDDHLDSHENHSRDSDHHTSWEVNSHETHLGRAAQGTVVHASMIVHDKKKPCDAPNGKGPKKLLKDLSALIPYNKIKTRYALYAAKDAQMQSLIKLLKHPEFRSTVSDLRRTQSFVVLRKYACSKLYLDTEYYAQFLKKLNGLNNLENVTDLSSESFNRRSGIHGFLLDVHDLLPKNEIHEVMDKAYQEDPTLVEVVTNLRSQEFHQLLKNVEHTEEYKTIRRMLKGLNIKQNDLDQIIEILVGVRGLD